MPGLFVNSVVSADHSLPCGQPGLWAPGGGCLGDRPPINTLGASRVFSCVFSCVSRVLPQLAAGGRSMSCAGPRERTRSWAWTLQPVPSSLRTLSCMVPFHCDA